VVLTLAPLILLGIALLSSYLPDVQRGSIR
jgi:hypothetical protein